ncbi:PRC-barrel domain containing protein [Virgibacillus doumboii]|uniref:PRC-barrel domain containing protein n=1 Tax=Virgibacillus doumboii TaxID=2697503 RepID=UPI0013DECA29|nr:PRC-barrel domain containing protein [Virgibacillus doumboii]
MLYLTTDLKAYNINAQDGEMGKIHDLYFDDKKWAIRYAVVDARKWLPSRRVLLSPASFEKMDEQGKMVDVKHDKETVRNSPSIPSDSAISEDMEIALTGYYGWSRYWMGSMLWGDQDSPISHFHNDSEAKASFRNEAQLNEGKKDYNLRSEEETLEYRVHANDGKIGKVTDMVFDDEYWKIRYLVVQMDDFPSGEKMFVFTPETIQSVDWFEGDIYADVELEALKQQKSFGSKEAIISSL